MNHVDMLVIGGGIAGLSAAARLARHGRVAVLEREQAPGYHASGRSATFCHYGIGGDVVRALTACSRPAFAAPAEAGMPAIARASPAVFVATAEMLPALAELHKGMARFSGDIEPVGPAAMQALFPPLRIGPDAVVAGLADRAGLKLDADALLHSHIRQIRTGGGIFRAGCEVTGISRDRACWTVIAGGESWTAPLLVNAAGAWADRIARMAGVRPLGLRPLRRTMIVVDPPIGADIRGWPFVKTVVDDFYILPESGRLIASAVDEVESDPCDAQPEEYDVALAAWKVERYTDLRVGRISHRWAGLRTFTADRVPAVGFAPDAPGFFWLAGQGGYGLQTAPAMASVCEALIVGIDWPHELAALGVRAANLAPERLFDD